MLSHCNGPQTWCHIKQTAANGGLIDCHGFSCLIYPPAIKRDNGTPPIHGAFNGTIIHKWWFFSLPCSISGVPQITGSCETQTPGGHTQQCGLDGSIARWFAGSCRCFLASTSQTAVTSSSSQSSRGTERSGSVRHGAVTCRKLQKALCSAVFVMQLV